MACAILGAVAVVFGGLLVYSGAVRTSPHIAAGVRISGVDVSGMTREEAAAVIRRDLQPLLNERVELVYGNESAWASMQDLGVAIDADESAAIAYEQGRHAGLIADLRARYQLRRHGLDLPAVVVRDEGRTRKALQRFSADIRREPRNARLELLADGQVRLIPGRSGRVLNLEETVARALTVLSSLHVRRVEMVVEEKAPQVATEDLQDINCVLSSFSTPYSAGQVDRSHNLQLACRAIDESLLRPGEVFSYNSAVGNRSKERGFRMAPVYADNDVRPGMGGGVCQPSTTLYNAALLAGLDIVERHPHMMPVHYVQLTRDATVEWAQGLDLRIRNNLTHPVFIKASAAGGRVTMTLLGNQSDKVDVDLIVSNISTTPAEVKEIPDETLEPGTRKVEEPGRAGHRGTLTRIVRRNGVEIKRDGHTDYYRPKTKVVLVGPSADGSVEIPVASAGGSAPGAKPAPAKPAPSKAGGAKPGVSRPSGEPSAPASKPSKPQSDGLEELFGSIAGG